MLLTYSELITHVDFHSRYVYLKLEAVVGTETFGALRHLNQDFYRSRTWRQVRDHVINRDNGMDLGVPGLHIPGKVFVHHMNPITIYDLEYRVERVLDPRYLITTSERTHRDIHFGSPLRHESPEIVRRPGDTDLWKRF